MINDLAILLTCVGVVLVAVRALSLDRASPWFPVLREPARRRGS